MENLKSEIKTKSKALGADDIAFVKNDTSDNFCTIVLFFRYYEPEEPISGFMPVSPYYIASNRGYHAAKKLTEHLRGLGFYAKQDTEMDVKAEALKCGGFIGENGFFYHNEFGSLVSIQTIETDAVSADCTKQSENGCKKCGACKAACPSGAVGDVQNCIRYHSNLSIPVHLRANLYQLLGCELCQTACPLNSKIKKPVPQFRTEELLSEQHIQEIQTIAGKNMARKQRLISQAAIYAANTKQKNAVEKLSELIQNAPPVVCEHAAWSLKILGEDK